FSRRQEGSGVIGVDVQRIRRALGLRAEPQPDLPPEDPRRDGLPRDALRRFEALLRRELERSQVERTGSLPPARPLGELDRALPSGPLADLAAVHRVVAQLRRRLATQGMQNRGHRRHAHVDVRRTMRASLQTGGVPVVLKYRPRRPKRPEIYVLCDVSTSVTSASVFFLSVLHALHDTFRKMRSFVFIERISEVTDIFEHERNFKTVSERISNDAGVADISGYTDYGRVWSEVLVQVEDELHPRATPRLLRAAAALACSLCLAACGSKQDVLTAPAAKPFSVMLDYFPNADHAALYSAIAHGDFRAVGLEVSPQAPADPAEPLKQLAAGKVDMAISYEPELLLVRNAGLKLVAIAALVQRPLSSIIALPGRHIGSVAALAGKRVG